MIRLYVKVVGGVIWQNSTTQWCSIKVNVTYQNNVYIMGWDLGPQLEYYNRVPVYSHYGWIEWNRMEFGMEWNWEWNEMKFRMCVSGDV